MSKISFSSLNRIYILLIIVALCLSAAPGLAENMVKALNPSFETDVPGSGVPSEWSSSTDYGAGLTTFDVVDSSTVAGIPDGSNAVSISTTPDTVNGNHVTSSLTSEDRILLQKDVTYRFSAQVMSDNSQWMRLVLFDIGYARAALLNIKPGITPIEWTEVEMFYTPDASTEYYIRVDSILAPDDPASVLYVDNIKVSEYRQTLTVLSMPNGDMEFGSRLYNINGIDFNVPFGWKGSDEDNTHNGSGMPVWDYSETLGRNDSAAPFMTTSSDGVGASHPEFYHDYVQIQPEDAGKPLMIRYYAKTVNSPVFRSFFIEDGFNYNQGVILGNGSSPLNWKKYQMQYTPSADYVFPRFDNVVLGSMAGEYTTYVDDVEMFVANQKPFGHLFLSPDTGSYTEGDEFDVDLQLNTNGNAVIGAEIHMIFDTALLEAVDLDPEKEGIQVDYTASVFSNVSLSPSNNAEARNTDGRISFTGLTPSMIPTAGDDLHIFTIRFKAKAGAGPANAEVIFEFDKTPNDGSGETRETRVIDLHTDDIIQGEVYPENITEGLYSISAP